MTEKEIAEIRRRFHPEKCNITHVRGCYVNDKREIVSQFDQPLSTMPQEEAEKLLSILKKTLSGTLSKNLIDITITTEQVVDSDEHRLLMALRSSGLKDEAAVQTFFEKVLSTLTLEENYLILLASDKYDVPYRSKDGEKQADASSDVFSYILCSICPIKTSTPALGYYLYDNAFRTSSPDWLVAPPELGFLFPAFDDRNANIYNALYYSKDITEGHEDFVSTVFCSQVPMPAAAQKEAFQSVLENTLAEDCNFQVLHAVNGRLCDIIEEHKANNETQPLTLSKERVKEVLLDCGVQQSQVNAFEVKFDDAFGPAPELSPRNLVDTKQFEVRTADVLIRVKPEHSGLIETKVINGVKYILIRVEDCVEVNGVMVQITE